MAATGCEPRAPRAFDPDRIPEAYARSTAALFRPGSTRAYQITPEGDLYDGEWRLRFQAPAGASLAAPRAIAYEERWRPVAHWRRRGAGVRWDFEAGALPAPAPRDSALLVSLEVTATNESRGPRTARLDATLDRPGRPPFVAFDAPPTGPALRWADGAPADTALGWSDTRGSGSTRTLEAILSPGASRRWRFVLPTYPTPGGELAAWARTPHARRMASVRAEWDEALGRGTQLQLGDPETEAAWRAARVVLLALRERRGARWVPIGGPFHYRDVWLRDGARAIHALAVSGHTREARELADGLRLLQWPQGAFVSQRGQLDGTGQALWAFEQALLRPSPAESLAVFADAARAAVRWYEGQRDLGRESGWPFGTMLPFAEPRDNELVRAQLVGNDLWALAGYRAAERLLRAAGRGAEAAEVAAARERYRTDFLAALDRTGRPDVPPSWQGVGRDWGNLAAVVPCGVLPADDPRFAALVRRVRGFAGATDFCTYGTRDTAQYYVGADLATWAWLAGARVEGDRVLEALLAWRSASGGGAEVFSRSTRDFGNNLPPHPTSAAALVVTLRNALLFDDGDTLRLTMGAHDRWWRGSRVTRAPTRWGQVNLTFRRTGDRAEWRWSPVSAWTRLSLPSGTRLATAPPATFAASADGRTVLVPPRTRQASIALAPAPEAP